MTKEVKDFNIRELKNLKDITYIKKYPFMAFSPSLIDYFLIIGYDTPTKNEIYANFVEHQNTPTKNEEKDKNNSIYQSEIKPVVLNSIGSDFINAALNEEIIIKHIFPGISTPIYYESIKGDRSEKNEPKIQNIILYLKANDIYEFDDAHNEKDELLKKDVMFNIYGHLFWELYNTTESRDFKKYRIYFPKVFVFISQYSCFKYYSFLSQNILFRIKNNLYFEIPLEIQLYNIINFTPSPINCNLYLELLISDDLITLKKNYSPQDDDIFKLRKTNDNSLIKNDKNILIYQSSSFPYLDINVPYLFVYYNIDMFIIIYLFSFLELKCLFFCSSLDPLNTIMYLIYIFSYPFNDISEINQIYTISKEEFLDPYNNIENNLIGVNCEYDPTMNIPDKYKNNNYIIISCESQNINMYYRGEHMNKYDSSSDLSKLYHYLKKLLNEETINAKYFLEKRLSSLFGNVNQSFLKYLNLYNSENKDTEPFFKELDFKEKINKDFKFQYNESDEYNQAIQKSFYYFNISILEYFHDMLYLQESSKSENELNEPDIQAYYEFNFKDKDEKADKLFDKSNDKHCFNEEDKIFLGYFRNTKKLKNYIEKFLKKNECQDVKRPQMIIAEEFMNENKAELKDDNKDYFLIISKFYQTSHKIRKINFNKFYIYYSENLAKKIYEYAQETKVLKLTNDNRNNTNKYFYTQKEIILDNNVLQRYSYILNNMDPNLLLELFPHLRFKNIENTVEEMGQNSFSDFLENMLLENRIYSLDEVISFIIVIIYIISLKKNKIIFHFFEEIMKTKLITKRCLLRKYIYFIIYLLNEKIKGKIKSNKNYIKELLVYKEIMSSINSNNNKSLDNGYYPNELLSDLIKNFNFFQNYYTTYLKKNPKYIQDNIKILEKYKDQNSNLLEEGVDYKIFMQNNACRDKGAIKDEVLVSISEALEYKGAIQTTCKTCKYKIRPNLFFVHVPNDRYNSVGFYSIIYSYRNAVRILNKILNNNEKTNIDDDYFGLCANIIFYITFKEGTNNLLSRYIATTIKDKEKSK